MPTRVVVIGQPATPIGIACEWDRERLPNVLDHEFVIIDLSTFPTNPEHIRLDELSALRDRLDRFVAKGRHVVVFMPTEFMKVRVKAEGNQSIAYRALQVVPCEFQIVEESGEVVIVPNKEDQWLLRRIRSWTYHFTVSSIHKNRNSHLRATATNLEGKLLAGVLEFRMGGFTFIPSPAYVSNRDVVTDLLGTLFPDELGSQEPDWASHIDIPGMTTIADEIAELDQEALRLTERRGTLQSQLAELKEFRRLVFESGIPLERIVSRTFQEMGGIVSDARFGDEEFVLEVGQVQCVVEVKGVGKSAAGTHVNQLLAHIVNAEEAGHRRKGILVVNGWRDLPLQQRDIGDHKTFPDNVIKFAKSNDIALISGKELLSAIQAVKQGTLAGGDVLSRLLCAAGAVSFS